jgi:hypothetical protein
MGYISGNSRTNALRYGGFPREKTDSELNQKSDYSASVIKKTNNQNYPADFCKFILIIEKDQQCT